MVSSGVPASSKWRGHRMAERMQALAGLGGQGDPSPLAVESEDVVKVVVAAERLDRSLQPQEHLPVMGDGASVL